MKAVTIWYFFVKFWVKLAIKLFYRRVEVRGLENFPEGKPVLLAPNHQNAFMDALVPAVFTPGQVNFLVRADVFKSKFARAIFNSLNMMPVYRQRDGVENLGRNQQIFEQCYTILRNKGTLLMFPEASHLGKRKVRTLSKGFARIAFGADTDPELSLDIQVVPVGINYSDYERSQSRLLLNYGKPIPLKKYRETFKENPPRAMLELRNDVQEGLSKEVIDIAEDKVNEAFEIEMEYIIPFFLHRHSGHIILQKEHDFHLKRIKQIEKIKQDDNYFNRTYIYGKKMQSLGLKAPLFFIREKDAGYWIVQNLFLLIMLPLFLFCWLLHAPAYFLIKTILHFFVSDKQFYSSIKLVGGLILFPLFGLIYIFIAAQLLNPDWLIILSMIAFYPISVLVIRELRLPFRYLFSAWKSFWLFIRNKSLYRYLHSIEVDILKTYNK